MPVVENHLFFFFKQKTAYEMRISDWSSDVCSSDLPALLAVLVWAPQLRSHTNLDMPRAGAGPRLYRSWLAWQVTLYMGFQSAVAYCVFGWLPLIRSEEHTSELQSLMRISYAVFCLKKKNKHKIKSNHDQTLYN